MKQAYDDSKNDFSVLESTDKDITKNISNQREGNNIIQRLKNEIVGIKQQKATLVKIKNEQKGELREIHKEFDNIPQIKEIKDLLEDTKRPTKRLEDELRDIQKTRLIKAEIMVNLNEQVKQLKSK